MNSLLSYTHFYLVGIKGVAMAALAQCLVDAGKVVRGSDVAETFVTDHLLSGIEIDEGFDQSFPTQTECVIYTAAHQGRFNPQVLAALDQGLPTFSHAEALGELFNQKQGIAVCGVGGKSTTSAMIAWILNTVSQDALTQPAFAIGVGDILGLGKTGQWSEKATWFVAEADEYVTDPSAPSRGEPITPRFSYLKPQITVCTNVKFDHPDVYRDFTHTKTTYQSFFKQMKPHGTLVMNIDDQPIWDELSNFDRQVEYFGESAAADWRLTHFSTQTGKSLVTFTYAQEEYQFELLLPGIFNVLNALAAVAAAFHAGVGIDLAIGALSSFRSTKRRAEYIGEKHDVLFYDDYAHHPSEVKGVIQAYKAWYPEHRLVVAFQSHTFSRTKALFDDFAHAFMHADQVVMIDIFPSAREKWDDTVSSDSLCQAINQVKPTLQATNLKNLPNLANWCQQHLQAGDVLLTIGAGDIYKVHQLLGL